MATPLAPGFQYTGKTRRRMGYGEVKHLAQAFGLPGDAIAQIAKGESGLNADVQQKDPGDGMVGYGLLQMTPNAWGKGSAAYKHMQSLGGVEAMKDPVKNMAMARFLYKSAGNKLTPWYGTRFLTNRSGEGKLGPVDHSKIPAAGATASATTQIPGQTVTSEVPTVDQAGFQQAQQRAALGSMIARRNPNSFLLRSGLLSTGSPALADFQGSKTITDQIPGRTVTNGSSVPSVGSAASGSGATAALGWARSKLGQHESGGANQGGIAGFLNQRFGMSGQPWCAMFTSAAVTKGGAPPSARTASVAQVRQKAQMGQGYVRGYINPATARSGDLVLFGNRHIGMVQSVHGGQIRYVGGNQSDGVSEGVTGLHGVSVVRPRYGAKR